MAVDFRRTPRARWLAAIFIPTLAASAASVVMPTAAQERSVASIEMQQQVVPCFSEPAGAGHPARIGFTLAEDGSLSNGPEVLTRGTAEVDQAFAQAALRAVQRCAPYEGVEAGNVEINFIPSAQAAADPTTPRFTGEAAADALAPYSTLPGFCFVDPRRSDYEWRIWEEVQPPSGRDEKVETVAIECEFLERSLEGAYDQPTSFALVARTQEPEGMSETLTGFLDRLEAQLTEEEALTPRFWESPPAEGTPMVARDELAVYTASRQLTPDGSISSTVVAGYTRVDGDTRTFVLASFDGSDIGPQSHESVAGLIAAAHEKRRPMPEAE